MGNNDKLTEQASGAVITLDPTQGLARGSSVEIDASADTIRFQRLSAVLASTGHGGCGGGGGPVPAYTEGVVVVGDDNLVQTGAISTGVSVIGHLNVIEGGSGCITVGLATNAAAGNVVIGGSGSMSLLSTAAATKLIGGCGTLCADITGDSASVFGGAGQMQATVRGNGADIQTGSGAAQVTLSGFGGVIATGAGAATITKNGAGGFVYEGVESAQTVFNINGAGTQAFGGDVVNVDANGVEVFTRAQIATRYSTAALQYQFTSGISGFLPDAEIAAALARTGDLFLPTGITPIGQGGQGCGAWNGCNGGYGCGGAARQVNFNGDGGAVHTGDRLTYVWMTGNNNSVYAGPASQVVVISSGSGDGIYAGLGVSNNYYSGGCGANYLDYLAAPGAVLVDLQRGYAINGGGGTDIIRNLNIVDALGGSTLIAGCADAALTIHGDGGQIRGGAGNDTLHGMGAGTTYVTGQGHDTVHADGAASDYRVASGNGSTLIDQAALGITGTLTFQAANTPQQLWFAQDAAGDLVISILGTPGVTTFEHWFATDGTGTQLARLNAGSGWLDNVGINNVEQAMAAYQTTHPGFDPATSAMPADPALAAAFAANVHMA